MSFGQMNLLCLLSALYRHHKHKQYVTLISYESRVQNVVQLYIGTVTEIKSIAPIHWTVPYSFTNSMRNLLSEHYPFRFWLNLPSRTNR